MGHLAERVVAVSSDGAAPQQHAVQPRSSEAFSNELAADGLAAEVQPHHTTWTGRQSSTVTAVFASRCCGYREPPTAAGAVRRDAAEPADGEG